MDVYWLVAPGKICKVPLARVHRVRYTFIDDTGFSGSFLVESTLQYTVHRTECTVCALYESQLGWENMTREDKSPQLTKHTWQSEIQLTLWHNQSGLGAGRGRTGGEERYNDPHFYPAPPPPAHSGLCSSDHSSQVCGKVKLFTLWTI